MMAITVASSSSPTRPIICSLLGATDLARSCKCHRMFPSPEGSVRARDAMRCVDLGQSIVRGMEGANACAAG